jgi:dihydrofolate reductase
VHTHNNICLAIVVAVADNGVIGRNNQLPWRLPNDLQYFKRVTLGKVVIMGRKTFESIGKPLPNRTNVVISRQPHFIADGTIVVQSLSQGMEFARNNALASADGEVMVIGGAQIYTESLPLTQRLYLTQVHGEIAGDAFFPVINWREWKEVRRERHSADEKNPYDYSFVVLDRVDTPAGGHNKF